MEAWVRCNKCYSPLKSSPRSFSLTQCQHIFCNRCVVSENKHCPLCNITGVLAITLQKPLQQAVLPYFRSLPQLMDEANQGARLQRTQALIVLHRLNEIEMKYQVLKKAYYEEWNQVKIPLIASCNNRKEEIKKNLRLLAIYQSQQRTTDSRNATRAADIKLSASSNHNNDHRIRQQAGPKNLNNGQSHLDARESVTPTWFTVRTHREPDIRSKIPRSVQFTSNQSPNYGRNVSFMPHQYQPRAILSDDSAGSSTPSDRLKVWSKIPHSVESKSTLSSFNSLSTTSTDSNDRRHLS